MENDIHPFSKETLIVVLKAAIIINVTIAIFFQDLAFLFTDALVNQSTSYILAVPFILSFLIYRKRKVVVATIPLKSEKLFKFFSETEVIGALLFATSLILYWYGSYTFSPLEYHILALPIFVSACVLILFNSQTLMALLFPIAFLFLLVPPPVKILYGFGSILSSASSSIAYSILRALNLPVILGMERGTPAIFLTLKDGTIASFTVDIACSGIHSLIGFFIFGIVMAYIVRGKIWKKATIFLIGFPIIYSLNISRIFSIVLIGYYAGTNLAMSVFHLLGGWILIFIGSIFILLISEKMFKVSIFADPKKCTSCKSIRLPSQNLCFQCGRIHHSHFPNINKKDLAKILAVIVSTILITSIQVPVFAITEGPAEIILQNPQGQEVPTTILPPIPDYTLTYLYRDSEFEKIAKQDLSLMYAYIPNDFNKNTIWVGLEIAGTRSPLHPWEVCLITYPTEQGMTLKARQLDLEDIELLQNPPIIGRYFSFRWLDERNYTQSVLYWYETSIFKLDSTSATKNVKISIIALPHEADTNDQVKNELITFGKQIATYWQPIKSWSYITVLISQNGLHLIAILLVGLCTLILFKIFKGQRIKQINFRTYQKLSKKDKIILDSVQKTETLHTLYNIEATYKKINNEHITTRNLFEKLQKMKAIGLINEKIINIQDEPFIVWRTQF